ncbi:MAG TPA: RNA polymerase sigma factor [Acidimicrobiales bacterium]|nr:RNA polymerase sigma factor [Acidimicrobiales bacterium]
MSDPGVSDEALLAGMAVGDEGAGVAFVRRYQRRVYGLALSILGDQALAYDIAQEAFLRAWLHAPVFDRRRGSVTAWLLTITRNLSIDALRMRRAVATDPSDQIWLNMVDKARPPEDLAGATDMRGRLAVALASLPPEQSRALVLTAIYGYTAEEVSKRESVPIGTAKSRVRRGLQRLRAATQLQGSGGEEQLGEALP